jgi:dephospho-CoA kinase
MQVWGLTGNIACGKSAVEGMLREAGLPVIDADVVAREVVEPGEPALAAIVDAFGDGVLGPDGRLDRPALGRIVFTDPAARRRLEAITHPAIGAAIARQVVGFAGQGHEHIVVSAALMVESGSFRNYAGVVAVTCPPAEQLRRLLARDGLSEAEARARIDSQMPQEEKAKHADVVIDNGGDRAATRRQVEAWLASLAN